MTSEKLRLSIVSAIIGFVIASALFGTCSRCPDPVIGRTSHSDTTKKPIDTPPIVGSGLGSLKYTFAPDRPPRLFKIRRPDSSEHTEGVLQSLTGDTVIVCDTVSGFVATIDTIDAGDTVRLSYYYPENVFLWEIRRISDSIEIINTTTTERVLEPVKFYEKPLFVSGVTAAILIAIFTATR